MADQTKKGRTGKIVLISLVGVLVLLVAGLVVYAAGYQELFPNTYIGECNVSGMSREEAVTLLEEAYPQENITGTGITLSCKGNQAALSLDELQMAYDHQGAAETAWKTANEGNVVAKAWRLLRNIFSRTAIEPQFTYDTKKLDAFVTELAGEYETEPVDYTYEVKENQVILYNKTNGKKVDRNALARELETRVWRGDFSELELEPVSLSPEPLNGKKLYKWLTAPVEEAAYEKGEDGVVKVRPGKYQCKLDRTALEEAITRLETSGKKKVTLKVTTVAPKNTTEDLTAHLYRDVLGEYTTYYSGTAARNSNVQLATSRVNGLELMPGDEFSYDKTILPRTYKNGYQAAPVYVGNKVESGMGGGICQPSSTLYGAALYANLEILERHNHSMLVSYMPAGLDATIAEGYLDLRLKNSTNYPIKIEGIAQGGKLTFRILGYNPDNISVELIRNGGGFYYTATRVVLKDGKEISREKLGASRYSPKEEEPEEEEEKEGEDPENPENPENAENPENPESAGDTPPAEQPEAEAPAEPEPAPTPEPAPFTVPETGTVAQ